MRDEKLNVLQKHNPKNITNNVVKVIKGGYCNYLFYLLAKSIFSNNTQDVENGKTDQNNLN
jgi:hypothetical protein